MALITAPTPVEAALPLSFICTVNGAGMLKPKIAPDAICSQVQRGIEAGLNTQLVAVSPPARVATRSARTLKVELSVRRPGIIAAIVTQQNRVMVKVHPEISIAVMDRAIDTRDIDMLAREIVKLISR